MRYYIAKYIKLLSLFLLMILLGGSTALGQTDYSGIFLIANNNDKTPTYNFNSPTTNYYMCPAEGYVFYIYEDDKDKYTTTDTGKPFVTTYQCYNHSEDYDLANALWEIQKIGNTNYYYIIHKKSEKYLTYNGKIDGTSKDGRMRFHLETNASPGNAAQFTITKTNNGYFNISPRNNSSNYLNPAKGNYDNLTAEPGNNNSYLGKEGAPSGISIYGIVGMYNSATDVGSRWYLETLKPVITYDSSNHKIVISHIDENATIYYTTNGDDPTTEQTENKGIHSVEITDVNSSVTIKAIAERSGIVSHISEIRIVPSATISFASFPIIYNGSAQEPTATVKDGNDEIPNSEYTVSYSNNNINAGETVTVTVTDKEGGDYIVYGSTTFTINPAEVTLTANSGSVAYDGTEKTLNGFTCSVEGLTFEGVTASGSGTNIGNYPVTFTGVTIDTTKDTSGNYVVSETVDGTLTITPKPLTITADSDTKVYDGTALTKNSYTSEGLMAGDVIESVTITGSQTNAGSSDNVPSAAVIKNATDDNVNANYNITYTNGTLEVTKKSLTITADAKSKAYGEDDPTLTYTSEGLINEDALTGALIRDAGKDVGVYAIKQGTLTAGNNYAIEYTGANLTITKVGLTITANNNTITYGAAPAGNGVSYEGFVNSETAAVLGGELSYDYSYTQYGDIGNTYTITPKGLTSTNYDIAFVAGTLTVNPKALTITAEAKSKYYGDADPELTYTSVGLVGSDAFTGELSREAGETVGTYAIYQNTLTAGSNYTTTYTGANLTINKKALTITANPKTIIYGNPPTNDGVTYSGFAGEEDKSVLSGTLTYAYNYTLYENVGSYTITPSGLTGTNYNISFVAGTLTVAQREVGLIWSETTTFTYDGNSHGLTATATELVNSDEIGITVTGAQTNAGDHTATASSLTGTKAGNYKLPTENTHAFTITPVGLTVTAKDHSITYGAAPAGNGVTYEGFVGEDDENKLGGTLGYDFSYTQFDDVGNTYTITPKGLTSTNYDISFVAGTLTVSQKEVGLSWGGTAFPYDGSPHAPTVTATGLVNGDEIGVTVSGVETNAGNHTATASALTGDKAGNYKLPATKTQSFTISRKSIGDGTLASGYILDFGEGNTILLTDDNIGKTMVISTDYSVSDDTDPSDKYSLRTVTGEGNYTGSFVIRNVIISFTTDTEEEEWSATFVAENGSEFDIGDGLVLPEGVSAFIISGIQGEWAIPEPLDYIPAGVPVLLFAHKPTYGFVPTIAEIETEAEIKDAQKARNMLEEVTESTADYDADTESAHFATKQIYLLYNNEFVFNKAGNLKKGKVYLNPNHTVPSSEPAPAHLKIAWNYVTGIKDGRWKIENGRSERWYTLDGRRLSCKPTAKGLYIVNGNKVVIK